MRYITIDCDRYGGSYSGAYYTAWVGDTPDEVSGGDTDCREFWLREDVKCGKGSSEQKAFYDLLATIGIWIGNFDLIDRSMSDTIEDKFIVVWSDKFIKMYPDTNRDN